MSQEQIRRIRSQITVAESRGDYKLSTSLRQRITRLSKTNQDRRLKRR